MYLETLLLLIAAPAIMLVWIAHVVFVLPALKRNGFEPRGVDDLFVHRDWKRYRQECEGSKAMYWVLWTVYLIALLAIVFNIAQFFLFPDLHLTW